MIEMELEMTAGVDYAPPAPGILPTKTSQLENDSGFLTPATMPTIPTKVSQLENDANYAPMTAIPSPVTVSKLVPTYATSEGCYVRSCDAYKYGSVVVMHLVMDVSDTVTANNAVLVTFGGIPNPIVNAPATLGRSDTFICTMLTADKVLKLVGGRSAVSRTYLSTTIVYMTEE